MSVTIERRTEPTTLDLTEYLRSRGRRPRRGEYGTWLVAVDGALVERSGEWLAVRRWLAEEYRGASLVLQP